MTSLFRLRLFGGFRLDSAGGDAIAIPHRKGAALLAYLGATLGSANTRDKLASLLWGQSEQHLARQSLRQILSKLGQGLGGGTAGILRLDGQMVRLDSDHVQIDASEFETLVALDDEASLTEAIGLYKGEFLAGLSTDAPDFEEWLDQSRSRFRDLALHGLSRLFEQHHDAGNLEPAARWAGQALRIDPFREDIHRRLMRMYAERGMRAAALAQYRECESLLRRELGVTPDDETVSLYQDISARSETPRDTTSGAPAPLAGTAVAMPDETPALVGFDRELAGLRHHLREVAQSGARLVLVAGDAGSGKTALLARFRWTAEQDDAVMVMARARPAEQSMNFAYWYGLLNTWALESQEDPVLNSLLVRQLAFLRGGPGTSARPRHDLSTEPWQAFDAMIRLIRRRGGDAALAVVMEDLHFTDEASLRLLSYAVRNMRQSPILFIATVCPELLSRRRELADMIRDLDRDRLLYRVAIPALGRAQVTALVRLLRQGRHTPTAAQMSLRDIWALSEGNPGIVVDAALADTHDRATGTPRGLPAALYVELVSRLDGLDDTVKQLAATASVIGERIGHGLLARAAKIPEEAALRGVEALIAAGVLTAKDDVLSFARGRFRLAQYRCLLPARRRKLHLAVAWAVAIEPIENPTAHFAALAHHYRAAGRPVDALRNEVRLAQVQTRQGAHAVAKRSFRRVLHALRAETNGPAELRCEVEARLGLAEIEEVVGDIAAALGALRVPAARIAAIQDATVRMRYLAALGRLNAVLGNEEIGRRYIRRATGKRRVDEDGLWQASDRILEFIHLLSGNFQAGIDRMATARKTARRHGLVADESAISSMICLLEAASGAADRAMAEAQAVINSGARLGDPRTMAVGMHVRGIAQTWRGDMSGAVLAFTNAIELAALSGDLPRLYSVYGYRGRALAIAGRRAEAIADLDTALSMADSLGLGFSRPLFQAWKAGVLAEMGDVDTALPAVGTALGMATTANRPWAYSVVLRARACALTHQRDFTGAERAIRIALSEQETMGLDFERTQSLVAYARILRTAGETQRAAELVRQAQKLLRKMKSGINREAARA